MRVQRQHIHRNYLWVVFGESKMIGLGALNAGGGFGVDVDGDGGDGASVAAITFSSPSRYFMGQR